MNGRCAVTVRADDGIKKLVFGNADMVSGKQHILYKEALSEDGSPTKTHLIITEDSLEVRRSGEAVSVMLFKEGETHSLRYRTPFGVIPMTLVTRHLTVTMEETRILASAQYDLRGEDGDPIPRAVDILIEPVPAPSR